MTSIHKYRNKNMKEKITVNSNNVGDILKLPCISTVNKMCEKFYYAFRWSGDETYLTDGDIIEYDGEKWIYRKLGN